VDLVRLFQFLLNPNGYPFIVPWLLFVCPSFSFNLQLPQLVRNLSARDSSHYESRLPGQQCDSDMTLTHDRFSSIKNVLPEETTDIGLDLITL